MTDPHNPQGRQMADESMVRNLAAQAEAIWPQESPIVAGYDLPADARILDVGCGTGEITTRLAETFGQAHLTGVDLIAPHLEIARARAARFGGRVEFREANAFALPWEDDAFDFTVCRHVLQAVPDPAKLVVELARVTKPGGRLHLVAEDYGMIYAHPTRLEVETMWTAVQHQVGPGFGTDLQVGRHLFPMLRAAGLERIEAHYLPVDTLRVPRETLARIFEAWRDGYAEVVAEHTDLTIEGARERFDAIIACIRDPGGWALWILPVYTALVPWKAPFGAGAPRAAR